MKLTRKENSSLFYLFTLFIALIFAIFFCIPHKSGKDTKPNYEETLASSGFTSVINLESSYSELYTFSDGNIYVADKTVTFSKGASLKSGAAVLYIKGWNSVYAYGEDAHEAITLYSQYSSGKNAKGATAGIEIGSNATLIIVGNGYLYAYGGDATSGANGAGGSSGEVQIDYNRMYCGKGGGGGGGGGGAAAGIGGNGGNGGAGGISRVGPGFVTCYSVDNSRRDGHSGGDGENGANCGSIGTLYALGSVYISAS